MMTAPWKIIFLGTPEFAIPTLSALVQSEHVVAIFTQPDRPKGRGQKFAPPPVKIFAENHKIPCFQPEKIHNKEITERIKSFNPDLMVVVAYGLYIPSKILDIPQYKTINVHPSLLPQYRGAAPMQWALINGDSKTGVTILYVSPEMDAGDMLLQKEFPLDPNSTFESLHNNLSQVGAHLLIETIHGLKNQTLRPIPQDSSKATQAPKLTKEMGHIHWNKSAIEIYNLIRGANPWPGTYTVIQGEPLKICSARLLKETGNGTPGKVSGILEEGMVVETATGQLLLTEVQKPNKRKMTVLEFLRGNPLKIGSFFDV